MTGIGLVDAMTSFLASKGLSIPLSLATVLHSGMPKRLASLPYPQSGLCMPIGRIDPPSMEWAVALINQSEYPLIPNLVPLLLLDDESFACVVASDLDDDPLPGEGAVVRWHMRLAKEDQQASLLDTDCMLFVESMCEELEARDEGLVRMLDQIGPAYELEYLEADKRPRDFVVRPVRIACQNVILGYAAFAHDSSIDGMSSPAWQTCEVPHVAAHEGVRALAALTLCDAYQSGGTMEIRFDRRCKVVANGTTAKSGTNVNVDVVYEAHPEEAVPASLRRYGRTVGVHLGGDEPGSDPAAISPEQARRLFMAVTPMPLGLAARVSDASIAGVATPERLCFTLLAQVWREIELDFLLAVSPRVASILEGGADWGARGARQAESAVCRAALMVGMFYRRLDTKDGAGNQESDTRVLEDNRVGVEWEVLGDDGAVRFSNLGSGKLPWQDLDWGTQRDLEEISSLLVLPRLALTSTILNAVRTEFPADTLCIALPAGATIAVSSEELANVVILRCPDRLAELDQQIERKLLDSRVSRS